MPSMVVLLVAGRARPFAEPIRGRCFVCVARRYRGFPPRHESLLMRFFDTAGAGLLFAAAARPAPAFAQDDPITGGGGPLSLSGEIAVVSDYRFRGLSLSDEEIALNRR